MKKRKGPRFEHTDRCDVYLGTYELDRVYDLYFCRGINLVARWGDETGGEYGSGLWFVRSVPQMSLAFALAMAPDSPLTADEKYWLQKTIVHT